MKIEMPSHKYKVLSLKQDGSKVIIHTHGYDKFVMLFYGDNFPSFPQNEQSHACVCDAVCPWNLCIKLTCDVYL